LGIRPMYLEVHSQAPEGGVPARVKAIEDLGSYRVMTLSLAGATLRAKLPEGRLFPSDEVWLNFPLEWTRLFADGRLVK